MNETPPSQDPKPDPDGPNARPEVPDAPEAVATGIAGDAAPDADLLAEGGPAPSAVEAASGEAVHASASDGEPAAPAVDAAPPSAAAATPAAPPSRDVTLVATLVAFAAGCLIALAAYVLVNDGRLRTAAAPQTYGIAKMSVPKGTAKRDGDTLVATAPARDVLVVATQSDFLARQLSAVDWDAFEIPPEADVRLLFTSDYKPRIVQNRPLAVEDGRVQPIALSGDPDWLGRITGLALVVRAPGATVRVRGVTVKSQSAMQLVGDRAREWFRFESWSGTSINNVTGGAPLQSLPLPVPVAVAALLALGALVLVRRFAPARLPGTIASLAAGLFIVAWAVVDLRWTANLARQNADTLDRYGGKDASARALAAEDGDLFRFLEQAKAAMPADPQRVVVLASAHYFRGRAGWHLLPHRAMWIPAVDMAPAPGVLRPGDYLVVWQDTHARFDAAAGRLRLDSGVDLPAKLVHGEGSAAVYAIL